MLRERTGCPLPTIKRYAADYEAGRHETDLAPYYGKDWTAKDLARLHGLLLGKDRPAPKRGQRSLFHDD